MSAPRHPWPRLSVTLAGLFPVELGRCMNCGADGDVERWQEHDEQDRPEPIIVLLCRPCSDRIIEPHPRLYRQLHAWEPLPGSMDLCTSCSRRDGTRCTHPDLKANGGPGLQVEYPRPGVAFMDGVRNGRRTGWREVLWQGPPTSCAGRTIPPGNEV